MARILATDPAVPRRCGRRRADPRPEVDLPAPPLAGPGAAATAVAVAVVLVAVSPCRRAGAKRRPSRRRPRRRRGARRPRPGPPATALHLLEDPRDVGPTTDADGRSWNVEQSTTREEWVTHDGSGRLRIVAGPSRFVGSGDRAEWEGAGRPEFLALGFGRRTEDRWLAAGLLRGRGRGAADRTGGAGRAAARRSRSRAGRRPGRRRDPRADRRRPAQPRRLAARSAAPYTRRRSGSRGRIPRRGDRPRGPERGRDRRHRRRRDPQLLLADLRPRHRPGARHRDDRPAGSGADEALGRRSSGRPSTSNRTGSNRCPKTKGSG